MQFYEDSIQLEYPMQKTTLIVVKCIELVGERLPMLLLLTIGILFLYSQKPQQAYSAVLQVAPTQSESNKIEIPLYTPTPTETPTPTLTPTPTFTPTPTIDPTADVTWDELAACESNGHWNDDTGNGYYGGLQFSQSAWNSVGGTGNPAQASQTEQIARGKMLEAQRGWEPWGACAKKLGLD